MGRMSGRILSAFDVCWPSRDDWQLLKLLSGRKRKPALPFEQLFQTAIIGPRFAADDGGRDQVAALAARPAALEPIFIAQAAFNGDAGDF